MAHWEGDKLTVYTPTGGIANCRHDIARDLGIPDEKVRVVCQYMGGNFGNKNQNQDADLIAAVLAKEAGAPVKLELSRKEDFIGMHGRWPTVAVLQGRRDERRHAARRSSCAAISGMGPYRKNSGAIGGIELYKCPNIETRRHPVYTNKTVSGELPRAGVSAGLLRHPVDDGRRRVQDEDGSGRVRPQEHDAEVPRRGRRTPTTRSTSASAAAPSSSTGRSAGVRSPGPIPGPIKRGAGVAVHGVPLRARPQQRRHPGGRERAVHAVCRRHRRRRRRQDDDGADRRRGARRAAVEGRRSSGATRIAVRTRSASPAAARRS